MCERTRIKNRIHGRLTTENVLFQRSDLYGRAGRAWLAAISLSPILRSEVDRLLRLHDAVTIEIGQLDAEVRRLRRDHPCDRAAAQHSRCRTLWSALSRRRDWYDRAISFES